MAVALVDISEGHIFIPPNEEYSTLTSEKGIFAAGDVVDKRYRQAIVACGDSCKAAMDVIHFLSQK